MIIFSHAQIGKWIVLKSSNSSLEFILSTLFDKYDVDDGSVSLDFSYSEIKSLMTSDFDRQLLDLAFSAGKSKSSLLKLGINLATTTENVKEKVAAIRLVDKEAEEKAKLKLECEISFTEQSIQSKRTKLEIKKNTWPEFALKDLETEIKVQEVKRNKLKEIQSEESNHAKLCLRRRVLRAKENIIRDQRLKQAGRSQVYKKQGAKRKLTDSDDEYVASMFSEHAGYHGLRNTVTEYIGTVDRNKRIKLEDIKKYYNMRRAERGESSISTGTARRRLAPRRKSSRVAKTHIGKCLISVAVPPRTENTSNENTHYARKYRSNIEKSLFSKLKFLPEIRDIVSSSKVLFKSKDDAHYVAPGTKEGFDRARQKKIYCPRDTEKRHGQPKYDFPDSTLYQTPGSHRILQKIPKETHDEDAEEKLARDPDWDYHHVYMRPKINQDSSGLTWSSEDLDLIVREPFITSNETGQDFSLSKDQFSCFRAVQLEIKLFLMMQNSSDEKFMAYNFARLINLRDKLRIQEEQLRAWPRERYLSIVVSRIVVTSSAVLESSSSKRVVFSEIKEFEDLTELARSLLRILDNMLPAVRPIRVDLVDSGPGQAPSQKDVILCDRILFHLLETNYYARVSLADHDSYMNYAERTNSAIREGFKNVIFVLKGILILICQMLTSSVISPGHP